MTKVKMDSDVPLGVGIALDALGNEIGRIAIPSGKQLDGTHTLFLDGTHTLVLSVEDYGRMLRAISNAGKAK